MTHVFIAPHPDDVALSCGGVLASLRELGQNVTIITVFSGDGASNGNGLTPYQREALGFGSDERSGLIVFNDVRRYQAVLMAFPVNAPLEPYFGVGGGILQVVGPRVDDSVTDPFDREELAAAAEEASSHAFATAIAGVQGRWGRLTAFGQAQIGTSPNRDKLLRGALYSVHGGIRIGLGSAKEGVRAGGY